MTARIHWDEERQVWVAVSLKFEFIESEGETRAEALQELHELLQEILHGESD